MQCVALFTSRTLTLTTSHEVSFE